jgi:hypothetical protein
MTFADHVIDTPVLDEIATRDHRSAVYEDNAHATRAALMANQVLQQTTMGQGGGPILLSEAEGGRKERDTTSVAARSYYMPPHWEPARTEPVRAEVDLDKFDERLGRMICDAMGIPPELTQSGSANRAANVQGTFFIINEKIKMEIAWLKAQIEYAIMICYGEAIDSGLDDLKRHAGVTGHPKFGTLLKRTAYNSIAVTMDCAPLMNDEQIKAMWRDGFMDKDQTKDLLQGAYCMSDDMFNLTAKPDRVPMPVDEIESAAMKMQKAKPTSGTSGGSK